MKYSKRIVVILMAMTMMVIMGSQATLAAEMNFSVEAKLPDNQVDKNATYFDLRVTPGVKQDLNVELQNNVEEVVTVIINTNTAITNGNGAIDYGEVKPKFDKSLKVPFSKMAKMESEVVLQPKEKKTVTIPVEIPAEPFDGIVLGGLHFSQKDEDEEGKKNGGMQIENKFAFVIGVRLSENDEPVDSDLKLLKVAAGQRNYRNTIIADLQNPMPRILGEMTVEADVYAINDLKTVVYHSKQSNLNMAPNSNFGYGINMDNKPFKAGKYLLKMTVEADGKTWPFEKEFEIKEDEAKKLNDRAVELEEEPTNYLLYIIIGGAVFGLIIICLIIWMVVQKRKHQAELKRKANKKKKRSSSSGSKRKKR